VTVHSYQIDKQSSQAAFNSSTRLDPAASCCDPILVIVAQSPFLQP
jgi:hypothetical protein